MGQKNFLHKNTCIEDKIKTVKNILSNKDTLKQENMSARKLASKKKNTLLNEITGFG